jgi:hypothetical protein
VQVTSIPVKRTFAIDDYDFDVTRTALEVYKSIHGNFLVPPKFIVPNGDVTYPIDTWGMNLGLNAKKLRMSGVHSEHKAKLDELGFIYEPVIEVHYSTVLPALKAYKAIHGDLIVPFLFVVPHDDNKYPIETWGMKLGPMVVEIRHKGVLAEHRAELEELGFCYESKSDLQFKRVYAALEAFKAKHGNLFIGKNFTVMEGDVNYPPETWGLKLGQVIRKIRKEDMFSKYRTKLEELGLAYTVVKPVVELD